MSLKSLLWKCVFQEFFSLWLAEEREASRHYLQMAELMIITESAFVLKGRTVKTSEKIRVVILPLAHEELLALSFFSYMHTSWVYHIWFSSYDAVPYYTDCCFQFICLGFSQPWSNTIGFKFSSGLKRCKYLYKQLWLTPYTFLILIFF